jgi:hypothetical protein
VEPVSCPDRNNFLKLHQARKVLKSRKRRQPLVGWWGGGRVDNNQESGGFQPIQQEGHDTNLGDEDNHKDGVFYPEDKDNNRQD